MANKADIVAEVARRTGLKRNEVQSALEALLHTISKALAEGKSVELRGFGTFKVVEREERKVNDLVRGGTITIPARKVPQFIPYGKLREVVDTAHREPKAWDVERHYRRGVEYMRRGELDPAIEEYQRVLSMDSQHVKARNNLGLIYYIKGDYKRAIQEYRAALEVDSNNVQLRSNLGAAYWERGMYNLAEQEFQKALEIDPQSPEAHYNLGVAYYKKGLYDQAIDELKRALQLNPHHYQTHYYLAGAYNQKGMLDEAIAAYEALLELNPNNGQAYWYLGTLYDRKGMRDKARDMFRKAHGLLGPRPGKDMMVKML